jgi:hypothetical protein
MLTTKSPQRPMKPQDSMPGLAMILCRQSRSRALAVSVIPQIQLVRTGRRSRIREDKNLSVIRRHAADLREHVKRIASGTAGKQAGGPEYQHQPPRGQDSVAQSHKPPSTIRIAAPK